MSSRLLGTLVLALAVPIVSPSSIAIASCGSNWDWSGGFGTFIHVYSSNGSMSPGIIDDAISAWDNACGMTAAGRGFPAMSRSNAASGIQVDVVYHNGRGNNCGLTHPRLRPGAPFRIEIWKKSRIAGGGPDYFCDRDDSLAHELGHVLGLGDCGSFDGTLMNTADTYWQNGNEYAAERGITSSECQHADDRFVTRFEVGHHPVGHFEIHISDSLPCNLERCSPIMLDIDGTGLLLSSREDGVLFDLDANGILDEISWSFEPDPRPFLWLDRDEDGNVNNGSELFGDSTPQPPGPVPNGFEALKVFDQASEGGNNDGSISVADSVYANLRLWWDTAPRNGVVDKDEVLTLGEAGVTWISLSYIDQRTCDQHGNVYRWHGTFGRNGAPVGAAIDVLFVGDTTDPSIETE